MLSSSNEIETLREAAARLAGQPVLEIIPANEGANSRIYRVRLPQTLVALKRYPVRPGDDRDRLETEWRALTFLRERGVDSVPAPLAREDSNRLMLMDWIEGDLAVAHRPGELDEALSFISRIFELSDDPDAKQFKLASEACLSAEIIVSQIEARLESFEDYQPLEQFLDTVFRPAMSALKKRVELELAKPELLVPALRRLIPADFGFHNVLRQPDSGLRYIDFDYFGWDDPVKLTADFILHPAMRLSEPEKAEVRRAMIAACAKDPDFAARLERHLPLYSLRWALILLNPFRRDRAHLWAGNGRSHETAWREQIEKVNSVLESGYALV